MFERVHLGADLLFRADPGTIPLITLSDYLSQQGSAPRLGIQLRNPVIEALFCCALLRCHVRKKWPQQFGAVRSPGPRTQSANVTRREIWPSISAPFDKFRQRKSRLLDRIQKLQRRTFLHQHDVIFTTEELRQVSQITRKLSLMFGWIEGLPFGDVTFGEWIENIDTGSSSFGLRIDVQL